MTGATASLPPRVRLGRKQLGFVALCGLLVLGALVAALIFAWPSVSLPAGQFEIGAGALPAPGDDPYFVAEGRFYLVNLEPGAGAHQGFGESDHEGGLLAFSTINPWPPAARGASYSGALDCVATTVRREGVLGMYRGATPPILNSFVLNAIMFAGYGHGSRVLQGHGLTEASRTFLAGSYAGALQVIASEKPPHIGFRGIGQKPE